MTERDWEASCPECGKSVEEIRQAENDKSSEDGYVTVQNEPRPGKTHKYYHKKCIEEASFTKGDIGDISLKKLFNRGKAPEDYAYIGCKHKFQ